MLLQVYTIRGGSASPLHRELELGGHRDAVDNLCWSPTNDSVLATTSSDKTVQIWDVRAGTKPVKVVPTKGENINLSWSPDGSTVAVGNKDDVITFIDAAKWEVQAKKAFSVEINEMKWNHAGDLFLLTTGSGALKVLDYPTLDEVIGTVPAHTSNCICLELDSKGKYFATGSGDALIMLWHATELACLRTFAHPNYGIRKLSFSFDGLLLAAASEDPTMALTFVETGEVVHRIDVPPGTFTVAWHPSQLILAFSGEEKNPQGVPAGLVSIFGLPS